MSWNRPGESRYGVHSIDHFTLEVPSLDQAGHFFGHFGLALERDGDAMLVRAFGDPHVWARLRQGPRKHLAWLAMNCYPNEFEALREQILAHGGREATAAVATDGPAFWFNDPDGNLIRLQPGPKTMPSRERHAGETLRGIGTRGVPGRAEAETVRPTRLSHVLMFTPDIERAIGFWRDALGLRLSDRSAKAVAFMHARHGSDHHLVAFASSPARGWHHSSWDVPSLDHVGRGAEQMRAAGYVEGWGTGRHVLGSNYFHYVRDPWGSFAEYSADIDYIPSQTVWPSGDFPPEDSLYFWGPSVPAYFIENGEAGAAHRGPVNESAMPAPRPRA